MGLNRHSRFTDRTSDDLSDWARYLARVRERNVRPPRMLDVLNKLRGKRTRIMDG